MAAIDELISTYLTACEVEGKTANTVTAYRATLRDFRRVGDRLGLPGAVESYTVPDVAVWGARHFVLIIVSRLRCPRSRRAAAVSAAYARDRLTGRVHCPALRRLS
jgi:hypothetical protein